MSLLLSLSAVLLASGSAEAAASKQEDPIVCTKNRQRSVGSNMLRGRVCKRKSEWAAEARETERELEMINGRGVTQPPPAPQQGGGPI